MNLSEILKEIELDISKLKKIEENMTKEHTELLTTMNNVITKIGKLDAYYIIERK